MPSCSRSNLRKICEESPWKRRAAGLFAGRDRLRVWDGLPFDARYGHPASAYECGNAEGPKRYLKTYSNKTIWNIFWSANNYAVPKPAPALTTKIQFWVGTDEWGSRFRDLKRAKRYLPQIEVVKIPGMMHGEYVQMHPEAFAKQALAFFIGSENEGEAI